MTLCSVRGRPKRTLLLSKGLIGYLLTVNIGLVPRVRFALGGARDVVIIDGDVDLAPSATMSNFKVDV